MRQQCTEQADKRSTTETDHPVKHVKPNTDEPAKILRKILSGTFRRAKLSKRPQTEDDWSTPIHCKFVTRANWPVIDALVHTHWPDIIERYTYLRKLCTNPPTNRDSIITLDEVPRAELRTADVSTLRRYSYIQGISTRTKILSIVHVHTLMEKEDTRRRVVFAPFEINNTWQHAGFGDGLDLPKLDEQVAVLEDTIGALCFDGPAFYTQLGISNIPAELGEVEGEEGVYLPEGAHFVFAVELEDKSIQLFRNVSVCTGQAHCVALAQIIMKTLAIASLKLAGAESCVKVTVYIDNGRFAGTEAASHKTWLAWKNIADSAGLEFDIDSEHAESYVFLGLCYSHRKKHLRLGPKASSKMLKHMSTVNTGQCYSWTVRQVLSVFGSLVWATTALKLIPAPYYFVYKYVRRRCTNSATGALTLQAPANIWPSVIQTLKDSSKR